MAKQMIANTKGEGERERERERERDRQTDRHRDRQIDTERETEREINECCGDTRRNCGESGEDYDHAERKWGKEVTEVNV